MSFRYALAAFAGLGFCALSSTARPGTLTVLHTFNSALEGNSTQAELTQGTDRRFYGANSSNGPDGNGSVYLINSDGTGFFSVSFGPFTGGGIQPVGGLTQASDGNFYGTTYLGGGNALGTFFQFTPSGVLSLLNFFNSGDPGAKPAGTLTEGVDGFLYGTAQLGGPDNYGTVFRANLADDTLTTVSPFMAGLDGLYPESDLTQASDGNFYGTTTRGGVSDAGTIFRVTPAGIRTVIYSFAGDADGRNPLRGVVPGRDGLLYGLTVSAGANNGGTIYRVTTTGLLSVLYSFMPQGDSPYTPYGRLVLASDGNFYGTTNLGGAFNAGAIFGVTPTGSVFNPVYSFTNGADGGYPAAGLVQGTDGKFYGTTAGLNGQDGTIFQLDLSLPVPTPQPILFAPATVNVGNTIVIKGDYFLGVTGVTFPGATAAIPAASFTVLSKTMLLAVVPTGAVSGVVTVTSGILSAPTPLALTVNTVTPPPVVGLPEVTITAPDPTATESGTDTGKFKIKRKGGDLTQPLTVLLEVKGSATAGVDYNLVYGSTVLSAGNNSITIPANKGGAAVIVQGLDNALVESDESVIIKVKPSTGYTVGTLNKAQVVIADDD